MFAWSHVVIVRHHYSWFITGICHQNKTDLIHIKQQNVEWLGSSSQQYWLPRKYDFIFNQQKGVWKWCIWGKNNVTKTFFKTKLLTKHVWMFIVCVAKDRRREFCIPINKSFYLRWNPKFQNFLFLMWNTEIQLGLGCFQWVLIADAF